jgi:hypothetical protein
LKGLYYAQWISTTIYFDIPGCGHLAVFAVHPPGVACTHNAECVADQAAHGTQITLRRLYERFLVYSRVDYPFAHPLWAYIHHHKREESCILDRRADTPRHFTFVYGLAPYGALRFLYKLRSLVDNLQKSMLISMYP